MCFQGCWWLLACGPLGKESGKLSYLSAVVESVEVFAGFLWEE